MRVLLRNQTRPEKKGFTNRVSHDDVYQAEIEKLIGHHGVSEKSPTLICMQ